MAPSEKGHRSAPWRAGPHSGVGLRLLLLSIFLALLTPRSAGAEILIPENSSIVFLQTTGPSAALGIGDYRTNVAGDNLPHEVVVNVACTPGESYVFQIFDPALDAAGNPPGVGADGVTPRVLDEIRGAADTTNYQLISPAGSTLADVTYSPGTSDADWTTLATVGPLAGVPGVDCGEYTLRASTSTDDDNAWRLRLLGGPDPDGGGPLIETFDPNLGPDLVRGTGEESFIGILFTSYQHGVVGCQDFFWYADAGETDMFMLNFDMDGSLSVTYTTPGGAAITGTVSGGTVWNDEPPQQATRPAFAAMSTFDALTDFAGDAIASPPAGLWSAELCVGTGNQYSFEVPSHLVFLAEPDLPAISLSKSDGLTTVTSPGMTTYTLTITNTGTGAAMPVAGPEIVDTLPAGMTFASCSVNSPLVGTCVDAGGGVVAIDLERQSASVPAFLPGTAAAPANSGTVTLTANVAAGLPDGTTLTNTASASWTDVYGNDPPSVSASDGNTTVALAEMPLPETGFAPDRPTQLPLQAEDRRYGSYGDLWLEIPALDVAIPILGVPLSPDGWDVTWLWGHAGYLVGTAFPTLRGNSVITAHAVLPSGLSGPFAGLGDLRYGDHVIVHAWGLRHVYEVRQVEHVAAGDRSVLRHEEQAWLTLVTCAAYDEVWGGYRARAVAHAVLVAIDTQVGEALRSDRDGVEQSLGTEIRFR
jgi:LPXTG-site transpeptidase (sortase) family protein